MVCKWRRERFDKATSLSFTAIVYASTGIVNPPRRCSRLGKSEFEALIHRGQVIRDGLPRFQLKISALL